MKERFVFVHSDVDDASLSPLEFRVLGHLSRRAGEDGQIYSSVADMAEVCRLQVNTVKRGLRGLLERNIVVSEQRMGKTAFRRINPPALWTKAPVRISTQGENRPRSETALTPGANIDPGPRAKNAPVRRSKKGNPSKEIRYTLPLSLNTVAFKQAYDLWLTHLKEKRSTPSGPCIEGQLKECEGKGEERAIAMIHHSIRKNWKGLFEAHGNHHNNGHSSKASSLRDDQTF